MIQQTLSKRQVDVSILIDGYKYYCEHTPKEEQLTKKEFKEIYTKWREQSEDIMLNRGDAIQLLGSIGEVRVVVKTRDFANLKPYRDIDWKKTKEIGQYVYYKDDERATIVWNRIRYPNHMKMYFFRPIRRIRRALVPKIKQENKQYFNAD